MAAHRTSITLDSALHAAAQKRMEQTFTSNFSDYVSWLIRQDVLQKDKQCADTLLISSSLAEPQATYDKPKKKEA
jgi:hypothetical protein